MGVEGRVGIEEGQTVSLRGPITKLPPIAQARSQFGIGEEDAAALRNQNAFVLAQQVQVAE